MSLSRLLALAIVFVIGLSFYLRDVQEAIIATNTENVARHSPFRELSLSDLTELEIRSAQGKELVKKTEQGFRLTSGVAARKKILKQLLDGISEMSLAAPLAELDKSTLSDYGFDSPSLEVRLEVAKQRRTLDFGSEHPITKRRYFSFDANPKVYSVDSYHFDSLTKGMQELADNSALCFDPENVVQLRVAPVTTAGATTAGFKVLRHDFQAEEAGHWLIEEVGSLTSPAQPGRQYAADARFVERKLQSLSKISGETLGKEQIETLNSNNLLLKLAVGLKEENNQGRTKVEARIYRGSSAGTFILHNLLEDKAYLISGGQYKDLLQGALQFKSRQPFVGMSESISPIEGSAAGSSSSDLEEWSKVAIEVTPRQRKILLALEVLSYDADLQERFFSDDKEKRWSFLLDSVATELTLGNALEGGGDPAQAPRHLRIRQVSGDSFQAVISAKQAKRLMSLRD